MYSAPASWASNRVWFHFNEANQQLSVEGRGVNATALEKVDRLVYIFNFLIMITNQTFGFAINLATKLREVESR